MINHHTSVMEVKHLPLEMVWGPEEHRLAILCVKGQIVVCVVRVI